MEFQTDRCLFDRMHFSFIWQLQHAQVVKDVLERIHIAAAAAAAASGGDIATAKEGGVLVVPSPPVEALVAGEALAQLALACLRFNIEVLSRARAGSCVHLFFEALEELVIQVGGYSTPSLPSSFLPSLRLFHFCLFG